MQLESTMRARAPVSHRRGNHKENQASRWFLGNNRQPSEFLSTVCCGSGVLCAIGGSLRLPAGRRLRRGDACALCELQLPGAGPAPRRRWLPTRRRRRRLRRRRLRPRRRRPNGLGGGCRLLRGIGARWRPRPRQAGHHRRRPPRLRLRRRLRPRRRPPRRRCRRCRLRLRRSVLNERCRRRPPRLRLRPRRLHPRRCQHRRRRDRVCGTYPG